MNKMVKFLLPLFLLSSSALTAHARDSKSAPIVAVFDLENRGSPLTDSEILGLSDYLSTKLSEGGSILVIPKDEIRKRITQQKLNFKKECFDSSCQIAIGKELAAEYSINSSISRIGSNCIITSQLYDLQKAASVDAASSRKKCNADALIEGVEYIAKRFIQSIGKSKDKKNVTANVKNEQKSALDANLIIRNPIDTIVKTTADIAKKVSPDSGIKVSVMPVTSEPKQKAKTGWSLGAGIAGLVLGAVSGGIGFAGILTDNYDLTLPLCATAASLQIIAVPVIKIGSKSAKGDGVWGNTGAEIVAWITYGFGTAFWALAGLVGSQGGIEYDKSGDVWSSGVILLYAGTILGTISTVLISVDSLLAYGQANTLLSKNPESDQANGIIISPSISPLPAPAQHPEATGMVFGLVGRF